MTTTTEPRCTIPDPYQYLIDCDQADPCVGTQTLYTVIDCPDGAPSMAEFCARYPDHPVCPAVVEVGEPPVPLPSTGAGGEAMRFGLATFLVLAGCALVRVTRR